MYGHKSDPTRVYAYGAKPPEGGDAELIREQLDASWRYRNDLVAQELDRRELVDALIRDHYPGLVHLDALIEDADREIERRRETIRAANAKRRSKDPSPSGRAELREIRGERKTLYAEHKALRKTAYADESVRAGLDGIDAVDLSERKRLRATSGLHWGTYLAVEQGLSGIRSGSPPRFVRRADWGGKIAVQIQGGASWAELVEGHGQCRFEAEPLPPNAKPGGRRSKRPYWRVFLRVGSEGRSPIWATARFVLHRPVPADAQVKWVYLVRKREGTREVWSVQFVLARSSWARQDTHTASGTASGTAALNLGWRTVDGGVRVATVVGDDGSRDELVIEHARIGGVEYADRLDGIRDREFDVARAALVDWLATEDAPDWLREETRTLHQWRSQARLAALVIRWRERRFDGDASIYERIEDWRAQDKHLYDWSAAERAQFRRWRDDTYRRFAARLRWRYETLVVDTTDWRQLARRPVAEEDTEGLSTRRTARLAAPGRLREILRSGHPEVVDVDPGGISTVCSRCGTDAAPDWDRVSDVMFRCEAGHEIDQDRNAARNLLERHPSAEVVNE